MSFTLDTPAQINNWYVLSAVSQLALEIKTGHNFYAAGSVYKGIRANLVDGLPPRATMRNKLMCLATLLENLPAGGAVVESARETLNAKLEELGLQISR
jgi:hypothetical protein